MTNIIIISLSFFSIDLIMTMSGRWGCDFMFFKKGKSNIDPSKNK